MMHSWPHRSRSDFLDELETFQLQELVHDSQIETGAVFIAISYQLRNSAIESGTSAQTRGDVR